MVHCEYPIVKILLNGIVNGIELAVRGVVVKG